jgi:hypothetical protein
MRTIGRIAMKKIIKRVCGRADGGQDIVGEKREVQRLPVRLRVCLSL